MLIMVVSAKSDAKDIAAAVAERMGTKVYRSEAALLEDVIELGMRALRSAVVIGSSTDLRTRSVEHARWAKLWRGAVAEVAIGVEPGDAQVAIDPSDMPLDQIANAVLTTGWRRCAC